MLSAYYNKMSRNVTSQNQLYLRSTPLHSIGFSLDDSLDSLLRVSGCEPVLALNIFKMVKGIV